MLARPEQTLFEHLKEVGEKSRKIAQAIKMNVPLGRISFIIGITHDFGKATSFFQRYITSKGNYRTKKKNHSSLSAYFCYHLLAKEEKEITPLIGWFIVQRHHGNLTDFSLDPETGEIARRIEKSHISLLKEQIKDIEANNLEEIKNIYRAFKVEADIEGFIHDVLDETIFDHLRRDYIIDELNLKRDLGTFYKILFLYSVLLDADKLDSAGTSIPQRANLPLKAVESYKKDVFGIPKRPIDKLREQAAEQVRKLINEIDLRQHIFSLTLPTGMGKTLTGFQSALVLRKRISETYGFRPRIIYSLPFLSIIEQNHDVLNKVLRHSLTRVSPSILLKHHYLSLGYADEEFDWNPSQALLLTEGWHSEIVITTFVQFFESLITNRNSRARKFHNMANSIIILDEVQAIPRMYWGAVKNALMILAEKYNSWIILMTATNPLFFEPDKEIIELVKNRVEYYGSLDRIDYHFDFEEKTIDKSKEEIVKVFNNEPDCDVMVVMNTIKSSKEMYLKLRADVDSDNVNCIYLSTHLLPRDRLQRIKEIKQSEGRKLIVSTQLIEAGVDIDIDIIFRDFAPLDSIIQTAGRCNRENESVKGSVNVVRLKDERGRNFCSYIYDQLLLDITSQIIGNVQTQSECDFNLESADRYFGECKQKGADEEEVIESLKNLRFSELKKFKLIKEEGETISVFIEKDKKAESVREQVEKILEEKKGYERRVAMLRLKQEFYSYVINVRFSGAADALEFLPQLGNIENLYYVPRANVEKWYDEETGFKFPESTFENRLI